MQVVRNPMTNTEEEEERRRREQQQAVEQQAQEVNTRAQEIFSPNRQNQQEGLTREQMSRVQLAFANPEATLVNPIQTSPAQQPQTTLPQNATQSLLRKEDHSQDKWYKGDQPTNSEIQAQIFRISQTDHTKGEELWNQYQTFLTDPSSPVYNPYRATTNQAVAALRELGMEGLENGATAEWIEQNRWLLNHVQYNAAGNVQAPSRRSTKEQKQAYYYLQLMQDEGQTEQAEQEWAALQEEVGYWTGREDLNLSDEEILNKIDWSKYKTLNDMNASWQKGTPLSLNRVIGYDDDALTGLIWAARNGADPNDPMNSVRAALGQGRQWQASEINEKLTPGTDSFNPFVVATAEEQAAYFGVSEFPRDWLEKNQGYGFGNDETAKKMYGAVYDAEMFTRKAEDELTGLNAWVERQLRTNSDPDTIIDLLQNYMDESCPSLKKMDAARIGGDKVTTTRGINYRLKDVENRIREDCLRINTAKRAVADFMTGGLFTNMENATRWVSDTVRAVTEAQNSAINAAGPTITEAGTPEEQLVWETNYNADDDEEQAAIHGLVNGGSLDGNAAYASAKGQLNSDAMHDYLGAHASDVARQEAEAKVSEAETSLRLLELGINPEKWQDPVGRLGQGNIDLYNRPVYMNDDGTISTVDSISFYDENEKKEILIPTIVNGQRVSDEQAIDYYYQTGEYLGKFDTVEESEAYADLLHKQQELLYPSDSNTPRVGASIGVPEGAPVVSSTGATDTGYQPRGVTNPIEAAIEEQEIERLKIKYQNQLDDNQAILDSRADEFAQARETIEGLFGEQETVEIIAELTNANKDNGYTAMSILDDYYELGRNYTPPKRTAYSRYETAMNEEGATLEEVTAQAKSDRSALISSIKHIDDIIDYLEKGNYNFNAEHYAIDSHDYYANIMAQREQMVRDLEYANYFLLRNNKDFESVVAEAKDEINAAWNNGPNLWEGISSLWQGDHRGEFTTLDKEAAMNEEAREEYEYTGRDSYMMVGLTDVERDTYVYLRKKEGPDAAKKFYDYLTNQDYGPVVTRTAEQMQEAYTQIANENPVLASAMTVVTGTAQIGGLVYSVIQQVLGKDINPDANAFAANSFNSTVRGTVGANIEAAMGGQGSIGGFIGKTGYGVIMSVLDSKYNSFLFGGIAGGMPKGVSEAFAATHSPLVAQLADFGIKFTGDLVAALPMGAQAASNTIWEAKHRDMSNEQALALGGLTLMLESVTEAFTIKNMDEAHKLGAAAAVAATEGGQKTAGRAVIDFFKKAATEWLDDPLGEAITEGLEELGDMFIGGQLSNYATRIAELKQYMPAEEAESQYWSEFWTNIAVAGGSGAFSSLLTTGSSWAMGRFTGRKGNTSVSGNENAAAQIQQNQEQVENRANVAEPDTSDNSIQQAKQAQEVTAREQQVEENGNVAEPSEDNSIQQAQEAQEIAAREEQVQQNGNVAEPTEDTSVAQAQQAQEVAAREEQVEQNGNVVEPTEDNSVQQAQVAQEVAAREEQVEQNGNVAEPSEDNSVQQAQEAQEIAAREEQVEQNGNVVEPTQSVNNPTTIASKIAALGAARKSDQGSQTDTIAAVLQPSTKTDLFSSGTASAAAQRLNSRFGNKAITFLQKALQFAHKNNIDAERVTDVVTFAALSDATDVSAALDAVANAGGRVTYANIEAFLNTVGPKLEDATSVELMRNKVHENMVAKETKKLVGQGALADVAPYEQQASQAQQEDRAATEQLEQAEATEQQMAENMTAAVEAFNQNPSDLGAKDSASRSIAALEGQKKVTEQLRQRKKNSTRKVKESTKQLAQKREQSLAQARTQAEANVEAARQQEIAAEMAAEQAAREAIAAAQAEAQQQENYAGAVEQTPPRVAFGRSIPATRTNGAEVQLTGVAYTIGSNTYFTTQDGKVISSKLLENSRQLVQAESENWGDAEWDSLEEGAPVVSLDISIPVTDARGNHREVVGILPIQQDADETPILFADGSRGVWEDLTPKKRKDARTFLDTLSANENKLHEAYQNSVDSETGAAYDISSEVTDNGVQSGSIDQGQTADTTELAGTPGRDDGRGDPVHAVEGAGREADSRGAEGAANSSAAVGRRNAGLRVLSREGKANLKRNNVTDMHLQRETDQGRFSSALADGKASNDHGAYVDNQSVDELTEKGAVMILSKNGLAGAAVGTVGKDAGNIFAVFKNRRSHARGASTSLMIQAIAEGGNKLDCFNGGLSKMYARTGFIPVARVAFNQEFAPEGWNFNRDGTPDVVFWMHNGDSADTVASKIGLSEADGGYHVYTADEISALPLFDDVTDENGKTQYGYDRAWDYRDQLLSQANSTESDVNQPNVEEPQQKTTRNRDYSFGSTSGNMPGASSTSRSVKNSPQRIAKNLAKKLNVGDFIGTRKMGMRVPKSVLGYYQRIAKYIAVRNSDAGEFSTTMHELGHAISYKIGLTGTPDMINQLDPIFAANYEQDQLPGEAFAEFMWRYMADEDAGRGFAGDAFVDEFEAKAREAGIWDDIQNSASELRAWVNASALEQMRSVIHKRSEKPKQTWRERFRGIIAQNVDASSAAEPVNSVIRAQNNGKVNFEEDVRKNALMMNHASQRAHNILTEGMTDSHWSRTGGISMADALGQINSKDADDFEAYLLARHSLDRDAQGKPVFSGFITKDGRTQTIEALEKAHPEFVKAAQDLHNFWKEFMQNFMVDTGYLSEKAFAEFNKLYPNYVPTYRVKDSRVNTGIKPGGKNFTIHKATGSTEDIYSPLDSMATMVNSIVSMVSRNNAALAFDQAFQKYEGLGVFGRRVTGDAKLSSVDTTDLQETVAEILLDAGNIDDDVIQKVFDTIGEKQEQWKSTGKTTLPNVVTVQRPNGTHALYEITDPELYKLLAGVNDTGTSPVWQAVGKITHGMSALTTGSNPVFAIRNFMRDFQNSVNYGSWASNYVTGAAKWIRAAYDVWTGGGEYQDYKALGGGGWTRIEADTPKGNADYRSEMFRGYNTENVGRTLKFAGKKLWDTVTLDRVNEVVEQASRYAEYRFGKQDRDTASGKAQAFLNSQDVSVDFSRRGNGRMAAELKQVIPFLGASMQGVYRTGRMFAEAERGRAPVRFAKTVLNTALTSAICSALLFKYSDDDEKEEFARMSDELKAGHFYLPNFAPDVFGDQPLLRIPLAQDPLTYAVHGAMTNAIWNGTTDAPVIELAAIGQQIVDNLNPFGSGTVFQPILGVQSNKNWYGSRIIPSRMASWDPSTQYAEDTPDIFVEAGRMLNVSPLNLQYLAEQYTGFLGQMAIPALSKDENTGTLGGFGAALTAARKRLTSDPLISNDVVSSFYDGATVVTQVSDAGKNERPLNMLRRGLSEEEAQAAFNEAKAMTTSGGVIYQTKKDIAKMYDEIDKIQASTELSDADKSTLIREKRRQLIDLALAANEAIGAYNEKYITGKNAITNMLTAGPTVDIAAATKKQQWETLDPAFQLAQNEPYMKQAMQVWEATGDGNALPHPARSFSKDHIDYTVSDEDWDAYVNDYQYAYADYMTGHSGDWEMLTEEERLAVLKKAHEKARDYSKNQYIKNH